MNSLDESTILNIAIAPAFQRHGLAHKPLQLLVTDAKKKGGKHDIFGGACIERVRH